jgi:hypothetical protein
MERKPPAFTLQAYEDAVKQLVRFVSWWKGQRGERHRKKPSMAMPWQQQVTRCAILGRSQTFARILVTQQIEAGRLIGADSLADPSADCLVVGHQDAFFPPQRQGCGFASVRWLNCCMRIGKAHP